MRTFIVTLIIILAVLLAALLGILLIGLGFLSIGWVFSRIFPLSQYEATIVALGAGAILILVVTRALQVIASRDDEEEEEKEEEEEEIDTYEFLPRRTRRDLKRRRAKH